MDTTTGSDAILEHMAALAARLDEQAARISSLETLNTELRTSLPVHTPDVVTVGTTKPKMGRRGILTKALFATAAAALLTVAKEAPTAEATTRTTLLGGSASTGNYGLAAAVDVLDPGTLIANIGGLGFGVIGTFGSPGYGPPFSAGVLGQGSGAFYGVVGLSEGNPGVFGQSTNGPGVVAQTASNSQPAVRGIGAALGVGGVGTGTGTGVRGEATAGFGLSGVATTGVGLSGSTVSSVGVFGSADAPGQIGSIGLVGRSGSGTGIVGQGATAARFDGPVIVNGSFTVAGGPKSAAVRHPDGDYRRMYCQESTEPWFEDFGSAELKNGRAEITLDADFDALVKGDDYLVFLTENGDCGGLYVGKKGPHRFEVRSRGGATAAGSFDYRVVSRRRDEVGRRLEKITVRNGRLGEALKLPELPPQFPIPDLPAPPNQPGRPR